MGCLQQLSMQQLAQLSINIWKKETHGHRPPLIADRPPLVANTPTPRPTAHGAGRQVTHSSRLKITSLWSKTVHKTDKVSRLKGKVLHRGLRVLKMNTNKHNHRVHKRWRTSLKDGQIWGVYWEKSRECIQPRQASLIPCRRSRACFELGTKATEDTQSRKKEQWWHIISSTKELVKDSV